MKNLIFLTAFSIMLLIGCDDTDILKKDLIMNIIERPDKLDSLVRSSAFFNEKFYKKNILDYPYRTLEKINYINEYKVHGIEFVGSKKRYVLIDSKDRSKGTEKYESILIAFKNQKIGIRFHFKFDELSKKWYFYSFGPSLNTWEP